MAGTDKKEHWEKIYSKKALTEVSWYQPVPTVSREMIESLDIPKDAAIIDIGGGDSMFADYLISHGYTDITVLDILANAVERAKTRLGARAASIKWIISDINDFIPAQKYDLWHDRAVFHFLTEPTEADNYREKVRNALNPHGKIIIGVFSDTGPDKCSGLPVRRYSQEDIIRHFGPYFRLLKSAYEKHHTPFDTIQDFVFCSFELL